MSSNKRKMSCSVCMRLIWLEEIVIYGIYEIDWNHMQKWVKLKNYNKRNEQEIIYTY